MHQGPETGDSLASTDPWLIRDAKGKAKPLGSLGALDKVAPESSVFQFGVPTPQATKLALANHLNSSSHDDKIFGEKQTDPSSRARPDSQGTQPGGSSSVSLCDHGLGSGPESEQLFKGLTDEQEAQIRSVIAKVPWLKKPEPRRTRYSRESKPSETSHFFQGLPVTE